MVVKTQCKSAGVTIEKVGGSGKGRELRKMMVKRILESMLMIVHISLKVPV
jgi:hypothetical protein